MKVEGIKTDTKLDGASKGSAKTELKLEYKDVEAVFAALGSNNEAVQLARVKELISILRLTSDEESEDVTAKISSASQTLLNLAPKNEIERMLATQMIGTHSAAMECLKRSMSEGQTFEGRDLNLKHAEKLMAIYTKQAETLNKLRGKGQQKITVKHVNVAAGGQAIVGNVEAGKSAPSTKETIVEIEDTGEEPIDVTPVRKPSKTKK